MASRARSSSPFAFSYNGKLPDFNREASYSYGHSSSGSKSSRRSVTPGRTRSLSLGSPTPNMKAHIGYPSPPQSYASSNSLSTGSFMLDYPSSANRTKENITVTVRFRPLSAREIQKGDEVSWCMQGDTTVRSVFNEGTAYAYDKVFGPTTNTKTVYDIAARNVVRGAMEGINGTVFAYGVTSSGKTHTMHGDQISPGIIPTAIQDVFKIIQETPGREFLLRVSYLEIYNEVINDLLDPAGQNLRVREDTQGTYVEGIKEEVVLSAAHALSLIAAGEEHRHVGSNNFNLFSSRSHTIFTLTIESSVCGGDLDDDGATLSQLNLIDLAGSESSKTETTGLRRKEGSYINKSLLTLGTVISKLSDGRAAHIPYRDSKLTRLLQSSLSGHGRISLICTITPASSNIEETNNTLKFAQRAKRVEIYAAPNRIMDEKSLIRKYQKEISILKQELEQLKRGIFGKQFPTSGHEDLFTLRQQLEAGQVQMQSRLEEEEQAKAALMGRIQRLTKLILVSTKSTIPGGFQQKLITNTAPTGSQHRRRHSLGEEERTEDMLLNPESGSSCGDPPVVNPSNNNNVDALVDVKLGQRRSFNWRGDESALFESTQAGELFSATAVGQQTSAVEVIAAEQMDLLGEQAKMLAGEIALCNSSLRRLSEQLTNSPDDPQLQAQVQKLKDEMSEKQHDMQLLEQRMMEGGAAATANASLVEMSQVISMLTTQLNEKAFELEIKAADNRILQEQLQAKIIEIKELQERNDELEKYQKDNSKDIVNGLLNANKALKDELCNLKYDLSVQASRTEELERGRRELEEGKGILLMHNQKLTSEASYAKELASAAATELKCLAEEARKLSLQNTQLSEELQAAKQMALQAISKPISNGYVSYGSESTLTSLLQLLKEKAKGLEIQLEEKKKKEIELQNRVDESRERETALENDVANMWVLVAKLKAHNPMNNFAKADVVDIYPTSNDSDSLKDLKTTDDRSKDGQRRPNCSEEEKQEIAELRTVISQLKGEELDDLDIDALEDLQNLHVEALTKLCQAKTKIQDRIREREREQILSLQEKDQQDEERTSHVCKVCFEAPTAAVLLPCRHFCLCKRCAIACTECPLCRSTIADRIITYTS